FEDFTLDVDRDLTRQVAARHGGGHFSDIADLAGEVPGQQVDVVGEVLPGAGDASHHGLAAELAIGADLARHAGDFRGERAQLVHPTRRSSDLFEDFTLDVDRDLA